jgi:hypothetical protein
MPVLIKVLFVSLAQKYAADLLVRALIEGLEKLAPRTESKVDDRIVEIIKAERVLITDTINKKIGG